MGRIPYVDWAAKGAYCRRVGRNATLLPEVFQVNRPLTPLASGEDEYLCEAFELGGSWRLNVDDPECDL